LSPSSSSSSQLSVSSLSPTVAEAEHRAIVGNDLAQVVGDAGADANANGDSVFVFFFVL